MRAKRTCGDCIHVYACSAWNSGGLLGFLNTTDAEHCVNWQRDERPRGKWTLHKDGSGTCSVCGYRQNDVWDLDNWQNFCGHCGADMREE